MKHVLAFAGSSSKKSINKKLVSLATKNLKELEFTLLDLNDFPLPLYSVDKEQENGFHDNVVKFNALLIATDGIVLSLAEHNGSYTVAFKNLYDWLSRLDKKVWKDKPMLLMSASPGSRGGATVMQAAQNHFPRTGAEIIANFSLPLFEKNFSEDQINDRELSTAFLRAVKEFEKRIINT